MSKSANFRKSLWLVLLAKAQNLSLRWSISSGTGIHGPKLVGPGLEVLRNLGPNRTENVGPVWILNFGPDKGCSKINTGTENPY